MPNCSAYIDSDTSKTNRDIRIRKYKSGNLLFLVNVRVLIEGFDAPITKDVCFFHLPRSSTTVIQIIGRALRIHEHKTIAKVILPYSTNEDCDNINYFLKVLAKNDTRIRQSYERKTIGGYINIKNVIIDKLNDDNMENDEFELRYELIYDSLGQMINSKEVWINMYNSVIKYVENPTKNTNHKTQSLLNWIRKQIVLFKSDNLNGDYK
jgi:superfamily II DNA or RNA helicase